MTKSFQWGPVWPWGRVEGLSERAEGVKRQGSGRDRTGGSFRLKHKANRWKKNNRTYEVTHFPVLCGGGGSHHRYACATQHARCSGGTSEAHLAASSNKAWQGLAGVGRQLREEENKHCHSFRACCVAFPAVGHRCLTCREGLKDVRWRLGLLLSSSPSSSLPLP